MAHQEKQYKFYNHNQSSLFQYLCITLVIKNYMSLKLLHSMIFNPFHKTQYQFPS